MLTTISGKAGNMSIVPDGIDFLIHHRAKIALAIGIEVQKDGAAAKIRQDELCHRIAEIQRSHRIRRSSERRYWRNWSRRPKNCLRITWLRS